MKVSHSLLTWACVQFTVTEALEGLVLPGTAYVLLGKAGAVLVRTLSCQVPAHHSVEC